MSSTNPYARYSTTELSHLIEDLDEDENPEQYAEITEEIARRTEEGAAYYSPRGIMILVLGIIGLILSMVSGILGIIVALVAWSMGHTALKQIQAADYTDQVEINNVSVGRICGAVGAFLFLGRLLFGLLTSRLIQ